jgi:hypothetical protein
MTGSRAKRSPASDVFDPVLAHADRFCALLQARERDLTARDAAPAWLIGRAGELRCVTGAMSEDVVAGRLSPDHAAIDLALHLKTLHEGFARVAGPSEPSCCFDAAPPTPTMLLRDLAASPSARGGRQ